MDRLLDAIDDRIRMLAQVFDPSPLDARVVLRGFDEIHEVRDVRVEALLQLLVRDSPFVREGAVGLGEREHVRIDSRAEMLERNPDPTSRGSLRPSTAMPTAAARAAR